MAFYKGLHCFMSLLLMSTLCCSASFTIFNTTDDIYDFTIQNAQKEPIASFEVLPHKAQSVPEIRGEGFDTLEVAYRPKNTLLQTLFQPFRFLTSWGIGERLANFPEEKKLQPASYEPRLAITQSFNSILFKDAQKKAQLALIGPYLSKALRYAAIERLKLRPAAGA